MASSSVTPESGVGSFSEKLWKFGEEVRSLVRVVVPPRKVGRIPPAYMKLKYC